MAPYELIVQAIKLDIDKGRLKQGDKLPTLAELQTRFNVSYGTIRSALLVLKAEKWVRGHQGQGMWVQEQDDL